MARALTAKAVEALKADPEKRIEVPDPALSGLYLVVQPSGSKSWALRYRFGGKPAKLTLGRWPVMGVADARAAATEALDTLDHGRNPAGEKKAREEAAAQTNRDTVAAVIELFLRRHASHNRRGDDVAAMFKREIMKKWGEREIQSIGKRDVIEVLDAIVDRGSPVTANRLRAHLNTLFNWAKGRDIVQANPLDGIKPPAPEKPRDRVLTDDEIRLFWNACDGLAYPFGPLYRILLLTGQRLREVAEMTWREVDGNTWTLPADRSKNGDEHVIPLSPEVLAILGGLPRIGRYLFSTTGETPVSGFTRAKERLDKLMGEAVNKDLPEGAEPVKIPPFTIHDLRRTAATGMAGLRFPPHVVEAVLNHRSGTRRGVAGVYNRFDYADEKRAALDAWARRVAALIEGEAENVVRIERAR
ncbi:tyrosine-type recombinase/integrase [Sinirhodobacter huangdaonensis]|uniref:Site-specific integrase n=1 Tax=Paenirhodobacter huangdaonensis TaxID=2501515 RepID=A0A3S3NBA5_9RHOB|nr:site-specific integrase [Sinirhodobacter huangdaonensis]RWR53337.1 site-specific integrase [Sinirhodobacter huangdaonensis]